MVFINKMDVNNKLTVTIFYFVIGISFFSLTKTVVSQHVGLTKEYCMEAFRPTCGKGEIVIMQHAYYGRIKIGRCMEMDYGLPSCANNELNYFDRMCSGKWHCEMVVPSNDLTAKLSCLKELSPYLEASFTCQKVFMPGKDRCISPERITVTKRVGYLASIVSTKTSCGLHESPWILEAKAGQQIFLNLLDFSWQNNSNINSKCQVKYGYILDMQSDDVINICGGGMRQKEIYLSNGQSVQIVLEGTAVQNNNFLIEFQARGCPKYDPPPYSWSQVENNTLLIRCEHSALQWKLRCIDDIWLGIKGTCEPPPTTVKVIAPKVASSMTKPKSKSGIPSITDNHVVAFAMMCVTLIVCCFVVVLGFHCTKRYELKMQKKTSQTMSMSKPGIQQNGTVRSSMIYRPVYGRDTLPIGTTELPPYTSPLPREERAPKLPQRTSLQGDNMIRSMADSDYLAPVGETGMEDNNSVQYYILENPAETMGNMSEEMYQSIHLHNSLGSNK